MVQEELDTCVQKKLNLKSYPAVYTKINLKWIWLSQVSQASADCPIWENP